MDKLPTLSIIFPTFNGISDTRECLQSLREVTYPSTSIETIIVDNNSSDGTVDTIKKEFREVTVLPQKENLGFAKAVNVGIKNCSGEYIFVTNNDVVFTPDFFKILVAYLFHHSETGVIGGKIYFKDAPTKISSSGYRFHPWIGTISSLSLPDETKESDWIQGCGMLFPRSLIKKVGYLDEEYFFNFEDQDFCLRARRKGFTIIYHPKAIMYHGEGKSISREGQKRKLKYWYISKISFISKNFPLATFVFFLFTHFFVVVPMRFFFQRQNVLSISIQGLILAIKSRKRVL